MIQRLTAVLAAIATLGASWAMGVAMADPGPPRLVLSDVGASTSAPITIDGLAPGAVVTRPYVVALTSTAPDALLAIEVDELRDLERDCNRPEINSGDITCDEFGGELSQQLLLSAALTTGGDCEDTTSTARVLGPTLLDEVAAVGVIDLDGLVTAEAARCLLLTFELPWAADNLVQTDLARFDLTIHAERAAPDARLLNSNASREDGRVRVAGETNLRTTQVRASTTGTVIALLGMLATASVVSGVVVLGLGRSRIQERRRRRRPG